MSVRFSFVTKFFAVAGAVLLAAAPAAAHADAFSFSFSGGSMSGSGYIVYSTNPVAGVPGASQILGVAGTFSDSALGISNATISGIVPTSLPVVNPDGTFLPPGSPSVGLGFSWDNLFYADGNSPAVCPPNPDEQPYPFGGGYLDIYGLMFTVESGGNTYVVDIWSNGVINIPGGPQLGLTYGVADALNGKVLSTYGAPFGGLSTVVGGAPLPTPEPESLVLLGTGVIGAAGMIRRRLTSR